MSNKPITVACPQCGHEVLWVSTSPYRPFCSERCKLIDIGQWANEEYRVAATEQESPEQVSPPDSFQS